MDMVAGRETLERAYKMKGIKKEQIVKNLRG